MLNREEDPANADFDHNVIVTATDPWGITIAGDQGAVSTVPQDVTITIDNVNEAPTINGGPTKITHDEGSTTDIDVDADPEKVQHPTYTATDQESNLEEDLCTNISGGSTCGWSLSGVDMGDFSISNVSNEGGTLGQLSFKKAPNFESPADADMDNMYMVTVVATDSGTPKMTATRDVVITVTNADETGSVTFSSVQPKVGRHFTASLSDPDGETTGVKWEWMRTSAGSESNPADCSDDSGFNTTIDEDSDSYTPKEADRYKCLEASATYTDPVGSTTAMAASANAVVANTDNVAPEFKEGGNKPVMQATRYIVESADAGADVVVNAGGTANSAETPDPDLVMATDPNGEADILTYTLGGPDKDSFKIAPATGQITVGADTKLDYESNKKTYMVTVTATDPSRAMTTIDVTIMVVDVNEAPEFTAPSEGDVERTVQENTRSLSIYTFRATDPESRKVYWSLDGEATRSPDMDRFTIRDNGMLSLKDSPNYEADTVLDSDRQYMVVVVASDDAPGAGITGEDPIMSSMKTVTVTVTDVEERGTITLAPKYPMWAMP